MRLSSTMPPAFVMRASSPGASGLWSMDTGRATMAPSTSTPSVTRESPTFDTSSAPPRSAAKTYVDPENSVSTALFPMSSRSSLSSTSRDARFMPSTSPGHAACAKTSSRYFSL